MIYVCLQHNIPSCESIHKDSLRILLYLVFTLLNGPAQRKRTPFIWNSLTNVNAHGQFQPRALINYYIVCIIESSPCKKYVTKYVYSLYRRCCTVQISRNHYQHPSVHIGSIHTYLYTRRHLYVVLSCTHRHEYSLMCTDCVHHFYIGGCPGTLRQHI